MITYGNNASGSGLNAFTIDTTNTNGILAINGTNNDTINNTNNIASLTFPVQATGTVFKPDPTNSYIPNFLPLVISDLPTFQLHYNTTDVTSVGGTPTTFDNFSLPANTYNTDGHVITSQYGGTLPLQISTYTFNFVGILDSVNTFNFSGISIGSLSVQTGSWNITCNTMRINSSKIRTIATLNMSVGTQNYTFSQFTELTVSGGFTVAQTMKLTCQTNVSGTAVFKFANVINNI